MPRGNVRHIQSFICILVILALKIETFKIDKNQQIDIGDILPAIKPRIAITFEQVTTLQQQQQNFLYVHMFCSFLVFLF